MKRKIISSLALAISITILLSSCNDFISGTTINLEANAQETSTSLEVTELTSTENIDEENNPDMTEHTTTESTTTEPTTTISEEERYAALLNNLPSSYDPYIREASDEATELFNYYYGEGKFHELSERQVGRVPALAEYFVRSIREPKVSDLAENYDDPFPQHEMVYYSQWDPRWAYEEYAGGFFGVNGCGPAVLSMVYSTLTGDMSFTPDKMGEFGKENGYAIDGAGTLWLMMSAGAEQLGLTVEELPLVKGLMLDSVANGRPIILIVGEGDFTSEGHFIVLHDVVDGEFEVMDPFNISNSDRTWSYEELEPQIRNIWSYSYE